MKITERQLRLRIRKMLKEEMRAMKRKRKFNESVSAGSIASDLKLDKKIVKFHYVYDGDEYDEYDKMKTFHIDLINHPLVSEDLKFDDDDLTVILNVYDDKTWCLFDEDGNGIPIRGIHNSSEASDLNDGEEVFKPLKLLKSKNKQIINGIIKYLEDEYL